MKKILLSILFVLFASSIFAQTQWGLGWRKDRISFHEIKADTATITCITTDTIQVNKYYYQVEIGVVDSTMIFVSDNGDTLEISRDKNDKFVFDLDLNGNRIFSVDTAATMQFTRDGDTLQFDSYKRIHVIEFEQAGTNIFWADSTGILYLANMLGVQTAIPFHELSVYDASPEWMLADTGLNKNYTTEAQAEDSAGVHVYTEADGDGRIDVLSKTGTSGNLYDDGTDFNVDASGDIYLDPAGNNVFPGTDDTDIFGSSTLRWKWGYFSDYVILGGKSQTATLVISGENTIVPTDSAFAVAITAGLPVVNFYATDGDVTTITDNTSDQLVLSGATGGYLFDDDILIATDDTYDLGSLTYRWNDIFASDYVYIGGGAVNQTAALLISQEKTPANTDSSIKVFMNAGVPTISGSATDADNSTIYWNTSDQIVVTGNSGGLITYSNIDPGTADTYTLGSTAAWGSAYITDNLCVGGKAQTASIYVSQEATFANTDSSVKIYVNAGVPTIAGAGTDGDQSTITWDTADQMDFTGALGGYTFDNDVIVSDSITTTTGFRNDAGSKLKGNVAIGRDAVGDNVIPVLTILGDADSDGTATTSETLQLTLTPNATPTSASWAFSNTQATGGYTFDEQVVVATGKAFKVGAIQWDYASTDSIDGEVIEDNTIDDDALDLGDITSADLTFDSNIVPNADGTYDLGAVGAADWDSLFVEDVVVDVNLDAAGIVAAGTLTTDVAAADLELTGTTITASGSNAAVPMTIDVKGSGGTGYIQFVDDNGAGVLAVGITTATDPSTLSIVDGGADNEPGTLQLYDDDGHGNYFWTNTANILRGATSIQADDDAGGYAVMDLDDGTIGASTQNGNFATATVYTSLAADVSQGANIGASATPFNLAYADSVHANWFGGSDFEIGDAGSDVTFDADTIKGTPVWKGEIRADSVLLGADHTIAGKLNLYGGATTVGSKLKMYNSVGEDGTQDFWVFEPNGTNFYLGVDDNDDTFIFSNAGNFTALGNIAGATYGSDASISDAELLTIDDVRTVALGGTGLATYAVGDILHATATGTLAGLADVAVGQLLTSGGINTISAWSINPTLQGVAPSLGIYGYGSTDTLFVAENNKGATRDSSFTILKNGQVTIYSTGNGLTVTRLAKDLMLNANMAGVGYAASIATTTGMALRLFTDGGTTASMCLVGTAGSVGIGTLTPKATSLTLGDKNIQRDLIVSREATPAGTDSSAQVGVLGGSGYVQMLSAAGYNCQFMGVQPAGYQSAQYQMWISLGRDTLFVRGAGNAFYVKLTDAGEVH